MALEVNITREDGFFLGEDKKIRLSVLGPDAAGLLPNEPGYVITWIDVTGWELEFVFRKKDKDTDDIVPLIRKTTADGIEILGNFAAINNPQRVVITLDSDDTTELKASVYRYSVKRTDTGNEGILVFGSIELLQATAH